MASCRLCGLKGLEWSENPDRKTGRHFLINTDIGAKHTCNERSFCHNCSLVFSSYDKGWRHMMNNEYHITSRWDTNNDESKRRAVELGVPTQLVNRPTQLVNRR